MGVGDLSFSAVASLRSIDSWIAVINGNMAGAGKVGYKASRVKFNGGTISNDRPVVSPRLGISIPEQSLGIAQTTIDFSQGAVTASTDFTHLAIQRTTASPGLFRLNTAFDGSGDFFYTFDGEFHLDSQGRLVDSNGLFVMSQDNDAIGIDAGDIVNDSIALDRVGISTVANPQLAIGFSRFGSSIFEELPGTAAGDVIDVTPDAVGNYTSVNGNGRVIPNALEASNASLTAAVPELSLAQKMFSAISKVITVAFSNIDTALQLGPR